MPINTIEEILSELRAGKMVIVMDDEQRENEGDLLMAAEHVRPEDINFMARFGRGLICLTLTPARCKQLRLPLMVSDTYADHRTNFTVSIEAASGVTTGISAQDRARTVRAAVQSNARPEDLCQPGHIFPLMAQLGGVLTRAGHTEAGCDLTQLAGLTPAAVIVEILNEDGSMARRPDLEKFAQQHALKMGTIADLIRYRLDKESFITRVAEQDIETDFGSFKLYCYEDHVNRQAHLCLVRGAIETVAAPLVRVHVRDTLRDVLNVHDTQRSWSLRAAMQRIAAEGQGVIVLLQANETPHELAEMMTQLQSDAAKPAAPVLRTYGVGAQILRDLGVTRMRVLSAPRQLLGLSGFGLEVLEYVD